MMARHNYHRDRAEDATAQAVAEAAALRQRVTELERENRELRDRLATITQPSPHTTPHTTHQPETQPRGTF